MRNFETLNGRHGRACEQALERLRLDVTRVQEDHFAALLGADHISKDKHRIAALKERFGRTDPAAEFAEAVAVRQIELCDLTGAGCFATRTAEFDDYVAGVDGYVLFDYENDANNGFNGLAFDVTTSPESLRAKLVALRSAIEQNKPIAQLRYCIDKNNDPISKPPKLLKTVLYLDRNESINIAAAFNSSARSLNDHEVNAVFYAQIVIIVDAIGQMHTDRQGYYKQLVGKVLRHLQTVRSSALEPLVNIENLNMRSLLDFADVVAEVFAIDPLRRSDYFAYLKPGVANTKTELTESQPVLSENQTDVWLNASQVERNFNIVWHTFIKLAKHFADNFPDSIRVDDGGRKIYSPNLVDQVLSQYRLNKAAESTAEKLKQQGYISVAAMCDVVKAAEITLLPIVMENGGYQRVEYTQNKHVILLSPELQALLIELLANDIPDDWMNSTDLEEARSLLGRPHHLLEKMEHITQRLVAESGHPENRYRRLMRRKGKPSVYFSPEVVAILDKEHPHVPDNFRSSRDFENDFAGSRKTLAKILNRIADGLPPSERIIRHNVNGRGNNAAYYGPLVQAEAKKILPPKNWLATSDIAERIGRTADIQRVRAKLTESADGNIECVRDIGTDIKSNRYWNPDFVRTVFPSFEW